MSRKLTVTKQEMSSQKQRNECELFIQSTIKSRLIVGHTKFDVWMFSFVCCCFTNRWIQWRITFGELNSFNQLIRQTNHMKINGKTMVQWKQDQNQYKTISTTSNIHFLHRICRFRFGCVYQMYSDAID